MSALLVLGKRSAVLGADAFTPQQAAGSPEMTPAQLADLDRKLSPAEQRRVDAFQAGEADALQKKEEATPYVDPKTGEKRTAVATYEYGGATKKPPPPPAPEAPPDAETPTWKKVVFAVLAACVVGGGALLLRKRIG